MLIQKAGPMCKVRWLRQQGQSFVEGLVVLPIFFFVAAGIAQLIWLLLAQHLLVSATSYVALHAATAPNNTTAHLMVFKQRMKPLRQSLPLPSINLIRPNKEQAQAVAEYNVDTNTYALDPEYARLQLKEKHDLSAEKAEKWLQLSTLQVEIRWCFQLKIPIVDQVFQHAFTDTEGECALENILYPGVYIPLTAVAKVPLHRKREWYYD